MTIALTELLKHQYNRGREANIFFWRDNIGDEIDVIVEKGNKLIPVEIKSGQTLTSDAFRNLKKWLKLAKEDIDQAFLCYGGEESYERSGIRVVPWMEVDRFFDVSCGF